MSLENRVAKLEQANGSANGMCQCYRVGRRDLRVYDGEEDNHVAAEADTRPSEACDQCGKPMKIIKLILVTAETVRPEEAGA